MDALTCSNALMWHVPGDLKSPHGALKNYRFVFFNMPCGLFSVGILCDKSFACVLYCHETAKIAQSSKYVCCCIIAEPKQIN